ncbi:hypothetical protein SARC_13004 [Sphaeroforma arctica JP610]|uniref:HP domain-containing protein n=1 Tax=Sphaeroforma arctica JP610 TaxID=667725 RepID=A0A0L0FEF0_9EUKA|nr:hypothetical protein SARC_13004 [Sphaeroforma arctica JP610]KNC74448.1 hypothetical protein SARC_13004 [Sphaeroforma arctica JP610]|eukprot:XP_014148350.1 hypothetical protein SARC_13004 [Sphaeroforma arctica JP610]
MVTPHFITFHRTVQIIQTIYPRPYKLTQKCHTYASLQYVSPYCTELTQLADALPAGVDPAAKENYLSEEDFTTMFAISRAEYNAMPKWRRIQKKKNTPLF